MIQFIQPIWLFAITGIVIPIIIHLWNIKQGKTLKIGSIRLLTQSSRQNARSLRLHDLLLLLLRCLLISLIAAILSKPLWPQSVTGQEEKGWIVMENHAMGETYARFQARIDSLVRAGFTFHYLEAGYPSAELENALKHSKDSVKENTASYWKLIQHMEQEVPLNLPVYLFTTNSLERFTGTRPRLSMNVIWQTYTPSDSVSTWPVAAFLSATDSIRVVTAESRPSATFYNVKDLSGNEQQNVGYRVEALDGKLLLNAAHSAGDNKVESKPVEVDTSILRITIFSENITHDARYLKAAIEAIGQFTSRKIILSVESREDNIQPGLNWLFWLSERPLNQRHSAQNILVYEKGKQGDMQSRIKSNDATTEGEPALYRSITAIDSSDDMSADIWTDGFGHSILNLKIEGHRNVYHFFSRFDPAWNDLPWSEEFPAIMLRLIAPGKPIAAAYPMDKRVIDSKQMTPLKNSNQPGAKNKPLKYTDLSYYLWLAAFVVFFLERIISLSAKKKVLYG